MTLPLVSVIIPAYNSAAYIARAINSALAQDYPNTEIIVVDDGSIDGTRDIVAQFNRVICIAQKNSGPAAARNAGIRASQGEFVAFLDADDEWLHARLTKTIQPMLDDPKIGLTWCRAIRQLPNGRGEVYGLRFQKMQPFPRILWPSALQCTPATTCRRAVLNQVGLFDEKLASREDQDLWIRMAEVAQVAEIPEPLVIVHVREDSLSRGMSFETEEASYYQVLDNALARRPDLYESCRATIMAEAYWFWAIKYLAAGNPREARRLLCKSLKRKFTRKTLLHFASTFIPRASLKKIYRSAFSRFVFLFISAY